MKLSEYLKSAGVTQQDFANEIGVYQSTISRYLIGRIPTRAVIEKIFLATNKKVTPGDFYNIKKPKKPTGFLKTFLNTKNTTGKTGKKIKQTGVQSVEQKRTKRTHVQVVQEVTKKTPKNPPKTPLIISGLNSIINQ